MTVSVIVPVYNEEKTIATTIRAINAVNISKQVIIVDDGSTDATREAIGMLCDQYQFILIRHEGNQGMPLAKYLLFRTRIWKPAPIIIHAW
ncbi:MAG: hypothetical protein UX15_C0019G0006 [Parcubacteria group bacterium GW2011_GWA1_45_7]|nr:MAG: hypothetical protein UX15_C0019G0006 [Parcubacteria group bacterium GW2011_GWA1_45_7]